MSSRALGRWTVRSVGIGEVSLAVAAARGIDRAGLARALHAGLEAGLDVIDVAAEADTERLVGDTLREMRLRDKVVCAARVPAITAKVDASIRDVLADRLPPRYVQAQVESTLRASRLDALPLVQLQLRASWRTSSMWPELVDTCARLVREGKVLEWGAFVERIEDDTAELVHEPWLASISVPYSLCERAADKVLEVAHAPPADDSAATKSTGLAAADMQSAGLTPELVIAAGLPAELVLAAVASTAPTSTSQRKPRREQPIAVLARRPLAGSALAGSLGPGVKLKPRDDRNDLDAATLERIAVGATKLSRFAKHVPPAAQSCAAAKQQLELNQRPDHVECATLAEVALRYVIVRGAIALPRLHRHEHVAEALTAALLPPLPHDVVEHLDI